MQILVTGSQGMLGTDLCRILMDSSEYQVSGIDIQEADITSKNAIDSYLKEKPFDIIIHCAAYTDVDGSEKEPELAYAINGKGTENIALLAQRLGAKLVYISTDFVFDGNKNEPYIESDIPNPISAYGKSKLVGEQYVQQLLTEYYLIRTSWLYGKHHKNFVDTILSKAKEGELLRVVNDQLGSPTYSIDLAIAIKNLIKTEKFGIYHISNSGICSWYDIACEILKIEMIDDKVKVVPITSEELGRLANRPKYSKLDTTKYEQTTGQSLRPWQDAVKEYLTTD